jgi:succinate dehydrogenase / fumarate reductase cytochrome b subunit
MAIHPEFRDLHDAEGRHDIYRMLVFGFSNEYVASFYILSIGLLCYHLSHGIGSMFQSLGLKNEVYASRINCGAQIAAVIIFAGYVAIPIAVMVGVIK